jgi:phage repressor protein C with HTH and peptisase S24 domain
MLGLVRVAGASMAPALGEGDLLLVRWGSQPRAGQVVLARWPGSVLACKRATRREGSGWWLLGDNPEQSEDSRQRGAGEVVARVVLRLRRGCGGS